MARNVNLEDEIQLLAEAVTSMKDHISRKDGMSKEDMHGTLLVLCLWAPVY
jgi:hypothetical protein